MTIVLDSQQIEMLGRNLLVAELLRDGVEVARPERDRGVDLIAYLDRDDSFVARPIQMKAASGASFGLDRKYERTRELLLVYVWNVTQPTGTVIYSLSYGEGVCVAESMGWTTTESWARGAYTTSRPSGRLLGLLEPYHVPWHVARPHPPLSGRRQHRRACSPTRVEHVGVRTGVLLPPAHRDPSPGPLASDAPLPGMRSGMTMIGWFVGSVLVTGLRIRSLWVQVPRSAPARTVLEPRPAIMMAPVS